MHSFQVSVNSLDKAGCTALHWAAHGGHVECAQILLSITGVQVDVQVCISPDIQGFLGYGHNVEAVVYLHRTVADGIKDQL